MKKHSFLLLEILIGFTLVIYCIAPIVKNSISLYRGETTRLEKLELERLADWTFSEIKEMLLKNEIPWSKLPELNETTSPFTLPEKTIHLPGSSKKTISRTFTLFGKGEKPGKNNEEYRNLYINISLDDQKYTYRLPVQKLNKSTLL